MDEKNAEQVPYRVHTSDQNQQTQTISSCDDHTENANPVHDNEAAADHYDNGSRRSTQREELSSLPLSGLSVYVIHIKDSLSDGPLPSDQILQELRKKGTEAMLGCEFYVPKDGEAIWI